MARTLDSLRLGPLQARADGNGLRGLHDGFGEVFRSIAFVIRDSQWRTPEAIARRVHFSPNNMGQFTITGRTELGRSAVAWKMIAQGAAHSIRFTSMITAEGALRLNRAGLVVLLPVKRYAGARCRAVHPNGQISLSTLPDRIAPHQPLRDLAGLRVQSVDGGQWSMTMQGEIFEIEDQRNWLDPTYKLYGRPLALPFPFQLRDGESHEQSIEWQRLEESAPLREHQPLRTKRGRVPALGLSMTSQRVSTSAAMTDAARLAKPAFFLHRIARSNVRAIDRVARFAATVGAELRVECIAPDKWAFANLVQSFPPRIKAAIKSVAMLGASKALLQVAEKLLPTSRIVGGTWTDFVQVNRNGAEGRDGIAFALCPTVHARDDRTLIDSLDALPDVFAAARRVAGTRELEIGPCSLRRRLRPRDGRPATTPKAADGTAYDVDPRQGQMIAAAWLAGVIAHASAEGIPAVCAFELAGPYGLVHFTRSGSQQAQPIQTPAFAVFAALAMARGQALRRIGIDTQRGAVFSVGTDDPELWLVDLAGRPRCWDAGDASIIRQLTMRKGQAHWRHERGTRSNTGRLRGLIKMSAYGIARLHFPAQLRQEHIDRFACQWLHRPAVA